MYGRSLRLFVRLLQHDVKFLDRNELNFVSPVSTLSRHFCFLPVPVNLSLCSIFLCGTKLALSPSSSSAKPPHQNFSTNVYSFVTISFKSSISLLSLWPVLALSFSRSFLSSRRIVNELRVFSGSNTQQLHISLFKKDVLRFKLLTILFSVQ